MAILSKIIQCASTFKCQSSTHSNPHSVCKLLKFLQVLLNNSFLIDFTFYSSLRVTAKLKRKYREYPQTSYSQPPTQNLLPLLTSSATVLHLFKWMNLP